MITKDRKDFIKSQKQLRKLTERVRFTIIQIDKLMQEYPVFSKSEGGSKLAKILNPLDFNNDAALHFGLGISFERQNVEKVTSGGKTMNNFLLVINYYLTKLLESEEITTLEGMRLERAKGIIEEILSNRGFK